MPGMVKAKPALRDRTWMRQLALERWDNEGGATAHERRPGASIREPERDRLRMTQGEMVQLRSRVIALENLLISVLAQGTERQLRIAHDSAVEVAPRPGSTQHRLTRHAANQMTRMVRRASDRRAGPRR